MNDIQNLIHKNYSNYAVVFAVALIAVVILLIVIIINQNNKIKYLRKPKYGFLGKPLYALMLIVFTFGGFGFVFYSANKPVDIQQTNADIKLSFEIYTKVINTNTLIYNISVIPKIDDNAWGNNNQYKFDVYWTITNTNVITDSESNLSLNNQGGLLKKLQKRKNIIKANIFFNNNSYEKEIVLNL